MHATYLFARVDSLSSSSRVFDMTKSSASAVCTHSQNGDGFSFFLFLFFLIELHAVFFSAVVIMWIYKIAIMASKRIRKLRNNFGKKKTNQQEQQHFQYDRPIVWQWSVQRICAIADERNNFLWQASESRWKEERRNETHNKNGEQRKSA